MNYSSRISKVQQKLKESSCDCLFITDFYNIFYLTGFRGVSVEERESTLLIEKDKANLFIPKMYEEPANQSRVDNLNLKVVDRRKGLFDEPKELFKNYSRIGFEGENLRFSEYNNLEDENYEMVDISGLIEKFRNQKDIDEIKLIKKAAEIADEIFENLELDNLKRKKEIEVVKLIKDLAYKLGAEDVSFDPIVASGTNSALPHHHPGDDVISDGILLIDLGVKFQGYCSDITRTFWIGSKDKLFKKRYQMLLEGQISSLNTVRAGYSFDKLLNPIDKALKDNYQHFSKYHSLGHGVGLQIHEKPYLRNISDQKLLKNQVITIEPGIYYPGWGGIRIEDLCLVGENGVEVLSKFDK